jgi:hypothetical protein
MFSLMCGRYIQKMNIYTKKIHNHIKTQM